jgi:hypothetical protein
MEAVYSSEMLGCLQIMLHYNSEDHTLCISAALQSFAVDCTSPLMQNMGCYPLLEMCLSQLSSDSCTSLRLYSYSIVIDIVFDFRV